MWVKKGNLMVNLNHVRMIEARQHDLKFHFINGEVQSFYFSAPEKRAAYDKIFYMLDSWNGCIDVAGDMEEEIKSKKT